MNLFPTNVRYITKIVIFVFRKLRCPVLAVIDNLKFDSYEFRQ